MHTRLTGRDGGVAGRYKKMWHGRSPRIHIKFRVREKSRTRFEHLDGSHTVAVELSHFFVLPD